MIKTIELNNIQSHKKTKLELDSGINIIIGSSNNGKSTILRAINWVNYNRPLGTDIIASHWTLDKKGNLIDEISASITDQDDYTVTRRRTKTENQYIISNLSDDDKVLSVVKSDVPIEVSQVLNLSDVNIQKQMDSPFLLSESDGEIAKYFNKLVRLDIIDKILSNAESKKRKLKTEIEHNKEFLEKKENEHSKYNWFDVAEKLIHKYEKFSEVENELKKEFLDIQNKLNEYEKLSKCVDYDISASEKLLERLNAQITISENLEEEINEIENSLNEYKNNSRYDYDFTEQEKLIGKYSSLLNDVEKIEDEVYELKCSLDEYAEHTSKIINAKDDIEKLKGKLPSTCPYCGNKINLSNF